MSRSLWKYVYTDNLLLKDILSSVQNTPCLTNSRESTILDEFVGKMIGVYNGKQYQYLTINKLMCGYKLGSFVQSKKRCIYRKLKKNNKKYLKKR